MKTGYREENGAVVLTMTRADYEGLLFILGFAIGSMRKADVPATNVVRLANRLNAGNPGFTPYETGGAS